MLQTIKELLIKIIYYRELKNIRNIILSYKRNPEDLETFIADKVFFDRLKINQAALLMAFWKNHHELLILNDYKEIHGNILDFGCGSGHLDILSNRKIFGIDLSPLAIQIANYNKSRVQNTQASFQVCDIIKDKIKDEGVFDSVWSTQVFEHIFDPKEIFDSLKTKVKKNGYMLITVPYKHAYEDEGHIHHFMSSEDLQNHLSKYIQVKSIKLYPQYHCLAALCQFN